MSANVIQFPLLFVRKPQDKRVYCIADSEASAEVVARLQVLGKLPALYHFGCDCLSAWRSYPAPLAFRHRPYAVTLQSLPAGGYSCSFRRLDARGN